jgi:hypothetical protein
VFRLIGERSESKALLERMNTKLDILIELR